MKKFLKVVTVVIIMLASSFGLTYNYYASIKYSEDVFFYSGKYRLAGTFLRPTLEGGPFPTVILLHGSGPMKRTHIVNSIQAKAFLSKGFAVLIFDKRGNGDSEGFFQDHNLLERIDDANSAIDYVKRRPDVDKNGIGLATNSQSGLFAPQLASVRKDIRFIFNRVGPVVTFGRVVLYQTRIRLLENSYTEEEAKEVLGVLKDYQDVLIQSIGNPHHYKKNRSRLIENFSRLKVKFSGRSYLPIYDVSRMPLQYDLNIEWQGYSFKYDPAYWLSKSSGVSYYYAFGKKDKLLPTDESVKILEELKSKGLDVTIKVYENDDHTLNHWSYFFSGAYPPGYLDTMGTWAKNILSN